MVKFYKQKCWQNRKNAKQTFRPISFFYGHHFNKQFASIFWEFFSIPKLLFSCDKNQIDLPLPFPTKYSLQIPIALISIFLQLSISIFLSISSNVPPIFSIASSYILFFRKMRFLPFAILIGLVQSIICQKTCCFVPKFCCFYYFYRKSVISSRVKYYVE